jgi:hypothetical protein
VINAPSEMAKVSEQERLKTDMDKNMSEAELQKFLDTVPMTKPDAQPATKSGKKAKFAEPAP